MLDQPARPHSGPTGDECERSPAAPTAASDLSLTTSFFDDSNSHTAASRERRPDEKRSRDTDPPRGDGDWFIPYQPPGSGVAPGFGKRLKIFLAGSVIVGGGLFALYRLADGAVERNDNRNGALNDPHEGDSPNTRPTTNPTSNPATRPAPTTNPVGRSNLPDRDGNLIATVDQALEQARSGTFQPF